MIQPNWYFVLFAIMLSSNLVFAQKSAPSSHFVFNDNFDGDILIQQVRVPKHGEAMYTYYEALGWRGLGAGYAGIQAHPKAHNFIFSIWDSNKHTAPIRAVYHGAGTETEKFGGEGTGLKSWNFKLGWSTDVWYTLVARCWKVDDHTHYGFWTQAGDSKKWTHLVTMDVAVNDARFQGGTDAFIEDWLNTGAKPRTTHLRGSWKRKMDGTWFAADQGRYSVNSWDLVEGKRSFDFRTNWDGGVSEDETGKFYFMISGGAETKPTVKNPSLHSIKREEKTPDYPRIKINELKVESKDKQLLVEWKLDDTTLPQFSYQLEVYGDPQQHDPQRQRKPLVSKHEKKAHSRTAMLDLSQLNLTEETYYLQLQCVDIFDGRSEPLVKVLGKESNNNPK